MSPQSENSMEGVSAFTLDRVNSLKLGPFGAKYSFRFFLLLSGFWSMWALPRHALNLSMERCGPGGRPVLSRR